MRSANRLILYLNILCAIRADFRFAPSQWEAALLCNDVSHWLGAILESALVMGWFLPGTVYVLVNFSWIITPWWRHQMEIFSALLAICAGNSPVPGEFPTQRPVTWSFDVYFDLRPNKRLSKQSLGWWLETLSPPLWRHRNAFRYWVSWAFSLTPWNLCYVRMTEGITTSQLNSEHVTASFYHKCADVHNGIGHTVND